MDLPALQTIPFFMQMDSPACMRVHIDTGMNSPAWTACWPTAIVAGLRPIVAVQLGAKHCQINPLIATLKPQSSGPSYSNTVIGTLAVDG